VRQRALLPLVETAVRNYTLPPPIPKSKSITQKVKPRTNENQDRSSHIWLAGYVATACRSDSESPQRNHSQKSNPIKTGRQNCPPVSTCSPSSPKLSPIHSCSHLLALIFLTHVLIIPSISCEARRQQLITPYLLLRVLAMQPPPRTRHPLLIYPATFPSQSRAGRLLQCRECHVCCEMVFVDIGGDLTQGEYMVTARGAAEGFEG